MSRTMNGRVRRNSAREAFVEQVPYNRDKKRKSFTRLHSYDDSDLSFRSTPEYLKQLMNTSISSNGYSARSLKRTHSASDMTSMNNLNRPSSAGNPKYKTQEEYYDEIHVLKKELKYIKDDNNNLKAKIRRLEEENARKRKEIDNICNPTKDTEVRRTLANSTSSSANVVLNLKQRLFKLELQLKQKETTIDEMKCDPRWTKGTELEMQNRALLNEIQKLKLEKINLINNDYAASLDEEKKNAIRKLEAERKELKLENESLKKKLGEMEKSEEQEKLSARKRDHSSEKDLRRKIEDLKESRKEDREELEQMKAKLKEMRQQRDTCQDELEDMKHELDQWRKKYNRVNDDLERLQSEHDRLKKSHDLRRSSPIPTRDDERSSKPRQSPHLRRDLSPDEFNRKDQRSTTPTKKLKEYESPRSPSRKFDRDVSPPSLSRKTPVPSKMSSRPGRRDDWNSDDENRVKNFRENRAATVIQKGWRKHQKSNKHSLTSKSRQNYLDKRNLKAGGMKSSEMQSPRASQKFSTKQDDYEKRPASAGISNESALKLVQAALRGHIHRTEVDKPPRTDRSFRVGSDDEDDSFRKPKKQFGSQHESDKKREKLFKDTKPNSIDSNGFHNDKFGPENRFLTNNRDMIFNSRRPMSPPIDGQRPSSPYVSGSKQALPFDRKPGHPIQNIRETNLKIQRPYSPSNEFRLNPHVSSDDVRSSPRQTNMSSRKSTAVPKQSVKSSFNDDDDIVGF